MIRAGLYMTCYWSCVQSTGKTRVVYVNDVGDIPKSRLWKFGGSLELKDLKLAEISFSEAVINANSFNEKAQTHRKNKNSHPTSSVLINF